MKQFDVDMSPPPSTINHTLGRVLMCSKSTGWHWLANYTCNSTSYKLNVHDPDMKIVFSDLVTLSSDLALQGLPTWYEGSELLSSQFWSIKIIWPHDLDLWHDLYLQGRPRCHHITSQYQILRHFNCYTFRDMIYCLVNTWETIPVVQINDTKQCNEIPQLSRVMGKCSLRPWTHVWGRF